MASSFSDIVTVVTNTCGKTRTFGFIPPHGKELDNNESVTIQGDLYSQIQTGNAAVDQRKYDSIQNAVDTDTIILNVNKRLIYVGAVDSAIAISAGDLVFLNTDDIRPASSFTWDTNLATTQAGFANVFLGVALDSHVANSGAVTNFRVDVSPQSVYRYTATSASYEVGATLGPAKAAGNALLNTTLEAAAAASSIARCVKKATTVTKVNVTIQSAYVGDSAADQQ